MKRIFYCLQYVFMAIFSLSTRLYGDLTNCVEYFSVGVVGGFFGSEDPNLTVWETYRYGGPFYCEQASQGVFTSTDRVVVPTAERSFVENCDAYVAVFGDSFSVGTVVELGWAIELNKSIAVLVLPAGITSIADAAVACCYSLEAIDMRRVRSIGIIRYIKSRAVSARLFM